MEFGRRIAAIFLDGGAGRALPEGVPRPRAGRRGGRRRWGRRGAAALLLLAVFLPRPAQPQGRETGEDLFRYGLNAYRDGLYEPAAELLKRYLAGRPAAVSAPAARFYLAEALRRSGHPKGAIAAYRDFISFHAADRRADAVRMRLAALLEKAKRPAAAGRVYASVKKPPWRAEALYRLAAIRLSKGNLTGAESALREFLVLVPTDRRAVNAAYERARILDRLSRYPEAAKAYAFALARFPRHPRGRRARRRLGLIQHKLGRSREAEATLVRLLRMAPEEGRRPEVRLTLAASRFALKRHARAASDFEAALRLPLSPEQRKTAMRGAASSWWIAGRHPEAAKAYLRLLRRDPKEKGALGRYLFSASRSGRCGKEGKKVLRNVVRLRARGAPLRPAGLLLLANCLRRAGMKKDALKEYEEVFRKAPRSPEGALAAVRAAELLEAAGREKEAAARYADAVAAGASAKGDARFRAALSRGALRASALFFRRKDCPAALKMLKAVPRRSVPEKARSEVASLRAECALRRGDRKTAEVYFREVLLGARRPKLAARARFQLAAIAEAEGDRKEALRRWEQALSLLPKAMKREARFRAGVIKRQMKDWDGARWLLAAFGRDVQADPARRRKAWLMLAEDSVAQKLWSRADEDLSRWAELKPGRDPSALRLWAVVLYRAGRCPAARGKARRAMAADLKPAERLALQRLLASCLLREKKFEEAAEYLRRIFEQNPKSPRALLSLAEATERGGDRAAAARFYSEFVTRFPGHRRRMETALRLGYLEKRLGRGKKALEAFRIARRSKRPEISEAARFEIARALERSGKGKAALRAYESLSGKGPPRSWWRRRATWRAAVLLEKRKAWRRAMNHYRRIARLIRRKKASAGPRGKLQAEAAEAATRVRRLALYLAAVKEREEKMRRREPLLR